MAPIEEALLDSIYEAAALPHLWPAVLQQLAEHHGARGAALFAAEAGHSEWMTSSSITHLFQSYIEQGWMKDNVRGAGMIATAPPHFVTDTDFFTEQQMLSVPVYRDFLEPLGFSAAAGTVVRGARDDLIVLTIEGFQSHRAARETLPRLDRLRPHIARSVSLMARIQLARADAMTSGLAAIHAPAAVVSGGGRLRSANPAFVETMGNRMFDGWARLRFSDAVLDNVFAEAVRTVRGLDPVVRSAVVPGDDGPLLGVMHLIPLRALSKDVFGADGLLLLIANAATKALPDVGVLRLLFDLTPTEAKLAQRLADGESLSDAAKGLGCAYATARVHLRSIFGKTGVTRQGQLVHLLQGYATASPDAAC